MYIFRRSRIMYWLVRDLAKKYTRSLIFGFCIGFFLSLAFWKIYPSLIQPLFYPVERIGMVGDVTLSTLPKQIQNQISSGLTHVDESGIITPGLAISWEATNSGQLFTFHLRNDLTWHDGEKVTARDVNYNIKNVTFTPLDDWTVQVSLTNPYGPFPILVSKPLFRNGLIGFGGYKICCIKLNGSTVKSLKLIPISKKLTEPARLYTFYTTEQLALTAFKLGEIDRIEDLSNSRDKNQIGRAKFIEVVKYNRIVTLFFNLKNSLLSEKSVRQALGYALPEFDEERATGPLSKISWAYTDSVRKYEHDDAQIKKLLSAAKIGTESGQLTITTFSQYLDDAQAIADSWTQAGIKTSVKVENSIQPDFDVLLTAIDLPPDPDQYQLWHSTQSNISNYVNVKIDKLLEDGRQEIDVDKRKKLYTDFARRLVDDSPALFLYYPKTYTLKRN